MKSFLLFISILLIYSCAAVKPYYKSESGKALKIDPSNIDYEVFLVGDIGLESNTLGPDELVTLIKSKLSKNVENQSVVFLGNSISKSGLADEETPEYNTHKQAIQNCMNQLKESTEHVVFIPGNNEWFDGENHTTEALQSSEKYLEELAGGRDIFAPDGGCGEPKIIELTDDLIIVIVDSQWLIQSDDSEERLKSGCDIDNNIEFIARMNEIVASNKNKNILISSHHPLYSNGKVGGNYPLKNHLLPAPIIGSLVTGIRKIMTGPQKFGSPEYEAYRSAFLAGIQNCEGCITVSSHENNLQYHAKDGNHFVVAGSGSVTDYVRKADGAEFASMSQGFVKIVHTKNKELWLEIYGVNQETKTLELEFRKMMHKKEFNNYEDKTVYKPKSEYEATIKANASDIYKNGGILFGKGYRKAWKAEVEAPLLWLDDTHGGLKPVQQGGGFQTRSLRLENPDGVQYVIRSIDKEVEKIVPPALRKTFLKNVIQSGISSSHPYGAFAIPKLAHAAKIYHANPKFIFLPPQIALGDYNKEFCNRMYLFEERPGGETSTHDDFGNTPKTVNTLKLLDKLASNHKHVVDQEFVLRSRLFDILIGDWDRHDDQWRWATSKLEGKTLYRPIPRDRDQVFFKNDGLINYLASRPFLNPGLRKFETEIDFLPGLIFNARHFDRTFMTMLNKEDFVNIATEMQGLITDQVIENALADWPENIQELDAEYIKKRLKARRADLVKYAEEYYYYLYKTVDVVGTNDKNIFKIEILDKNRVEVNVYHKEENEKHKIFSNIIYGDHTKELRLFGLKKSDSFILSGNKRSTIKIRIIGGSGEDNIDNQSLNKDVVVYDRPGGMNVSGHHKSNIKDEDGVNRYNRKDFKQDRKINFFLPTFNSDEGLGINLNRWVTNFGFRSDPYKSKNTFSASYFFKTSAIAVGYSGHFPKAINNWDFHLNLSVDGPTFTQFYYGLGNTYTDFADVFPAIPEASTPTFHVIKGTQIEIKPGFSKELGKISRVKFTPGIQYLNLVNEDDEPRLFLTNDSDLPENALKEKFYAGLGIEFETGRVDNPTIPSRGYNFSVSSEFRQSLNTSDYTNFTFSSGLKTYIPFNQSNSVVLAFNIGGSYTFGEYEFFHANYLSSNTRMRGFKTNRFAGDALVYHATDLRIKLFEFKGSFPSGVILFGSFDYGRVFLEDEDNNDLHTSFGGGILLTPLNMLGFKIGYYMAEEDKQLVIGGSLNF